MMATRDLEIRKDGGSKTGNAIDLIPSSTAYKHHSIRLIPYLNNSQGIQIFIIFHVFLFSCQPDSCKFSIHFMHVSYFL